MQANNGALNLHGLRSLSIWACLSVIGGYTLADGFKDKPRWIKAADYTSSKDWHLKAQHLSSRGANPYAFPLKPGFRFIMERPDHPDGQYRKEVIVLDKTESFNLPGIGQFEAAVVQAEEYIDNHWTQHTLNWFAIDKTNNNMYSFGEVSWEIDAQGNKIFAGTWRAGEADGHGVAVPGMLMPGDFKVGYRYIAGGGKSSAFSGAEIMETGLTLTTPAGIFKHCVRVREQNLIDVSDRTDKTWCRGIGLVNDTSEGKLIASDALPNTNLTAFGRYHRDAKGASTPSTLSTAKISSSQATQIALKAVPGKAQSVSIERKRGHNVYVVEVIAKKDKVETDVFVDIETGKVVGIDR